MQLQTHHLAVLGHVYGMPANGHKSPLTPLTLDVARLIETRMLLQANSGAGKSWALRRILEQTWGACQHLLIDVEGEFHTLREHFDYVLAGPRGIGADCPAEVRSAALLARRLLELGASAIIDISELGHARTLFVKLFIQALLDAPKDLWHPTMVAVDESQMFCPESGQSESAAAIIDLMTRGRKRGFCGLLATQRIAKLHKDAAAEANNKLIGRSGLDIDMKRAAAELGFTSKDDIAKLRTLPAGDFFAFGPAISTDVVRVTIGPVVTPHPKAGARAPTFTPKKQAREVLAKLADLPRDADAEAKSVDELRARVRELEGEVKRAKAEVPEPAPARVIERAVLKDAELKRAEAIIEKAEKTARTARETISAVTERVIATVDGLRASVAKASDTEPPALAAFTARNRRLWGQLEAALGRAPTDVELVGAVMDAAQRDRLWAPGSAPGYNHPPVIAAAPTDQRITVNGRAPRRRPEPRGVGFDAARDQLASARAVGAEPLAKMDRAMLIAIAQHPQGLTRNQVLMFSGYQRSGTTNKAFARLLADGLAESHTQRMIATDRGLKLLGAFEPLPVGDALREKVLRDLPTMHAAILWAVCQSYPHPINRQQALGDYARSGTTNKAFAKLIVMGYLRKVPGGVIAATELFS